MLLTFNDFEQATDKAKFVQGAIGAYKSSDFYRTAALADEYDKQKNPTITQAIRTLFTAKGSQVEDFTASNHRIASNLFSRLNTQRCMYSLANGVSFVDPYEAKEAKEDETKKALGPHFDHVLKEAAYHALIHGCSYLFWDMDKVYEFKATEFVPLDDESTGALRAGIRFWQLDSNRPMKAVLYEKDGYTKYQTVKGQLVEEQAKRGYKVTYQYTEAGDIIDTEEENYASLPVVRMYASRLKQSTLVGMQEAIDAYDLILSGFANDLSDCAQIYWIVENYGGMDEQDLAQFLDRLKLNHIANADTQSGGKVTPYTQEIPYQARKAFLDDLKARIYEDFGALDVHTVSADSTNDHLEAAYQPLDENAADFEHWVSDAIVQLLKLQGIEDAPIFKRNRVSNQREQVEMLVQEAAWLDPATIIRKLPNVSPEEYAAAVQSLQEAEMERMAMIGTQAPSIGEEEE